MVRVLSIDRFLGVGTTHPFVAKLEKDGEVFIGFIKLKNNPEGILCLVNELISFRLAKACGVLMPESGIAVIDDNTTDNTYTNLVTADSMGNCFYSKQIEKALPLNEMIMPYIQNKDMYEKVILFDHLIYNTDRNPGNLVFSSKKREKTLYAIDHSHVFKNQAIWDANCLRQGIRENDFKSEEIISSSRAYEYFAQDKQITANSLNQVAELFKRYCTESIIQSSVESVPDDWPIDRDNLNALKEYLLYRSNHLNDICRMIVRVKGWKNE